MIDIDLTNFPFTFKDDEVYGTTNNYFKTPVTKYYKGKVSLIDSFHGSFIIPVLRKRPYYNFK